MMNMRHWIMIGILASAPAIAAGGMALAQVEAPSDTEAHAVAPDSQGAAADVPAPGEIQPDKGFSVEASEVTFPAPAGYRAIAFEGLADADLAGQPLYDPAGDEVARLADAPLPGDGIAIEGYIPSGDNQSGEPGQALLPLGAVSIYRNDDGDLRAYTSFEAEDIAARLEQGAAE